MKKRVLASLLSLVMILTLLPMPALAAAPTTYEVSTPEEFMAAVNQTRNAPEKSDHVISLQDNVDLSGKTVEFYNNNGWGKVIITILGNGHTLTTDNFGVVGSASLNLGQENGNDTLILKNGNTEPIVYATGFGELNIYDGVTLRDNKVAGSPGGIQLYGGAYCYMYGGTIQDCQDESSTAGGVLVHERARFYMRGGTIKNCSGRAGGAVCVSGNGRFEMYDGLIEGCIGDDGGAVYLGEVDPVGSFSGPYKMSFTMYGGTIRNCRTQDPDGKYGQGGAVCLNHAGGSFTMEGGEISGNFAKMGGGLSVNAGTATVSSGMALCNNCVEAQAEAQGDDIYTSGNGTVLELKGVPAKQTLTSTGNKIDGWYQDDAPRWSSTNATEIEAGTYTEARGLKAAHGLPKYTVSYDLKGGTPVVGENYSDQIIAEGDMVILALAPTKDGYHFISWTDGITTYTAGEKLIVTKDIILTAVWEIDASPQYTVTFDLNYPGATEAEQQTVESGKIATKPADPERNGYVFLGWYTAATSGIPYDFTSEVTADIALYAQWVKEHTVNYVLSGGTIGGAATYPPSKVKDGGSLTLTATPTRDGYTFTGWSAGTVTYKTGDTLTVTGDITLIAQWNKNGGSGGEVTTYYTLRYESNGGTEYRDERHGRNTVVQLDKVPVREGCRFTGWYADRGLTERITSIKMTGDKTVYAGWRKAIVPNMLNGDDHFAYIIGYSDGTVRPNANISRAEAATIFFRLLKPEARDGSLTISNTFTDVNKGMWCNMSISTMAELGIVRGRTAEIFDPTAPITRAEFAAICARFDTGMAEGASKLSDISGHWAEAEIKRAVSLGWIMGYTDGTFRPNNYITRAEAMTMINRVLCRIPEDAEDLLPDMNVWPDNQPGAWYYLTVQEATNSHDFRYKGEIYEYWTGLNADPDWTRYQD